MMEPNIIEKLHNYEQDDSQNKSPMGEDYINKDDLLSNDLFCIVFTILTLCNQEFATVYEFEELKEGELITFNREKFVEMMNMYFYFLSHDQNLVEVFKKLIGFEKYQEGKRKNNNIAIKSIIF